MCLFIPVMSSRINESHIGSNNKNRQIELKATCNISTIEFFKKTWYYKHYNANFFKDISNVEQLIGIQLATDTKYATEHNGSFMIECNYIQNAGVETWVSDYGEFPMFCNDLQSSMPITQDSNENIYDKIDHIFTKTCVDLTSLSEGKWIKTNPRIWESNQIYYKINERTNKIESIVSPKDPIITGRPNARKTSEMDTEMLNQHIIAMMTPYKILNTLMFKKELPQEKTYQFNQVIQENNHTIPYVVLRGIDNNMAIIPCIKQLIITQFKKTLDINLEHDNFILQRIPITSPLLHRPGEYALIMYYIAPQFDVRFNTLNDQKNFWLTFRDLLNSSYRYSNYRYFTKTNNTYEEKYYIDFSVYEPYTSIPLFIGNKGQVVCPSTCYPTSGDNQMITFTLTDPKPVMPLISFTQTQLEPVLKVAFPDVNTASFKQLIGNQITFTRNNCIMDIIEPDHACTYPTGTIILNTLFERTTQTKSAMCEIRYKCECCPANKGERIAYIQNTMSPNTNPNTMENNDMIFEPVSLKEELTFPDDMIFEEVIKNTDIGCAHLFKRLYKDRYIFNPNDDSFYYFKGDVWEQDKKPYNFTETIIATKLSECMDTHIKEIKDELDRELDRQMQDRELIIQLRQKLKKCNDQRERLTNGRSRVKTFLKTNLADKKFDSKLQHPGKIAAANGLVDLKTGDLKVFRPKDYITKKGKHPFYKCSCLPGTCFDRNANGDIICNSVIATQMQQIDDIVREIQGCDVELDDGTLKYADRLYHHWKWCIGYGVSGCGNRKYLMYCHSPANSGKTFLLDGVIEVMNEYFGVIPKGALFGRKGANGPSPELVMIKNLRGGLCDEVGRDDKIDDRNAKGLTGRSRMEYRGMCQEYESHKFKIVPFIAANIYFDFDSLDAALWDRFLPIIFPMHFARTGVRKGNKKGVERLRDESLADLFETSIMKEGYYNWVVRASIYYCNNQDKELPREIFEKLKELKKESFALDEFIEQTDHYSFDVDSTVNIKDLYEDFKSFAQNNNIKSKMGYSLSQFRTMLKEMSSDDSYDRCIDIQKERGVRGKVLVKGIKLLEPEQPTIDYDFIGDDILIQPTRTSHKRKSYDHDPSPDMPLSKKINH